MSETLTTLISFVGFLILFSMAIQAVQEGVKNLLKLKMGVWQQFFRDLYQKDFRLNPEPGREKTSYLESITSRETVGDFSKRLTRISDMVTRADDLIKTLKRSLVEIINLRTDAAGYREKLAAQIEVMTRSVREITGLKLDVLLNIFDTYNNSVIKNFADDLASFDKLFLRHTLTTYAESPGLLKAECEKLLAAINKGEAAISDYRIQIENNMDSWLAQVNDEYRRNMLKWTVVLGAVIVIAFNADSFSIYKYLSGNAQTQQALIQAAAKSTVQIQKTSGDGLNKLDAAIRSAKLKEAKDLLMQLLDALKEDLDFYQDTDSLKIIEDLRKKAAAIDPSAAERSAVVDALKTASGETARLYVLLQKRTVDYQLATFTTLELPLGWKADWKAMTGAAGDQLCIVLFRKLGGLVLTIVLVTFGAPFWNDILSALAGVKNMTLEKK
jgi:ABC-type phosphate/phosphonate transport system permease subunit